MPLEKVGENGWRWGKHGKVYQGEQGKKLAIKQGIAIEGPDKFKEMASDQLDSDEDREIAYDVYNESFASAAEKFIQNTNLYMAMAYISEHTRDAIPSEDFANEKDRSFPIRNQHDLDSASHLVGKAPNPAATKRRIIEIAKRKGLKLPAAWS